MTGYRRYVLCYVRLGARVQSLGKLLVKKLKITTPSDYNTLLRRVKETLVEGQQRIEAERVRTYWETGHLIFTHTLEHKERADYGDQVLDKLADDLQVHVSLLRRCVQFREKYPKLPIHAARREFTWTHYRQLMTVPDDKKRTLLEEAVSRNSWSTYELAERIKSGKFKPESESSRQPTVSKSLLTPLRGELYTYRLVTRPTLGAGEKSGLLVDCGFGFFRDIESRWAEGDIVRSRPSEDAYKFSKIDATAKDLFTYAAFVEKVIDGDTLKVRLDLGFESWTRQVLRLRGIDCPEVDTKAGAEAKAFAQSYVKEAQQIIVRSSRSDKYDRYLADVFIPTGSEPDAATDIFLNNLLLERGHAVRMA